MAEPDVFLESSCRQMDRELDQYQNRLGYPCSLLYGDYKSHLGYPCYLLYSNYGLRDLWVCSRSAQTPSEMRNWWSKQSKLHSRRDILIYKILSPWTYWATWLKFWKTDRPVYED